MKKFYFKLRCKLNKPYLIIRKETPFEDPVFCAYCRVLISLHDKSKDVIKTLPL